MAIRLRSVLVGQPQSTGCRHSEVLEQDLLKAAMVRGLQDRTCMERLREQGFFSQKKTRLQGELSTTTWVWEGVRGCADFPWRTTGTGQETTGTR